MHEVALCPVAEGIAHGNGFLDGIAFHIDTVTAYPYLGGRVEHLVAARHLEERRCGAVLEIDPLLAAVETDDAGVVLDTHLLIDGKVRQPLHTVAVAQGEDGQALAGLSLLARMNAVLQSGIHQHRHAGVGNHRLGFQLLFAQQLTVFPSDEAIVVGGYLTIVEREVALPPVVAPSLYHAGHQRSVVVVAGNVVLALIPDGSFHGVPDERFQLSVVEGCRTALLQLIDILLGDVLVYLGESLQPFGLHPSLAG